MLQPVAAAQDDLVALGSSISIEECRQRFAGFFEGGSLQPFLRTCASMQVSTVAQLRDNFGAVHEGARLLDEFNGEAGLCWAMTVLEIFGMEPKGGWTEYVDDNPRSAVVFAV